MSQNRRSYEWNEEATEATGLLEHELADLEVGDAFEADGKAKKRIALRVFKRSSDAPAQQDVIVPETLRAK